MRNIERIKTELGALNWDFVEDDTKYLTHAIHRYSGKYIPQIPKSIIEITTKPGDIILDPYLGSGTTALEAALAKRKCIGIDLSPVAILISKVKTTPISNNILEKAYSLHSRDIKEIIAYRVKSGQTNLFETDDKNRFNFEKFEDPWFQKWYKTPILKELIRIQSLIEREKNPDLKNLFNVAFSDTVRVVSNAHPSYPNVMYNKKLPERRYPAEIYLGRLKKILDSVAELNKKVTSEFIPTCIEGDARKIPLENECIDSIIGHPPYIGAVPYAEYQLLSLKWLGHDPRELDNKLTGGRRQKSDVVERFEKDMRITLCELYRVIKKGGIMSLVIGNPVVKGERIELDKLLSEESKKIGFKEIIVYERKKCNMRANKMPTEFILSFYK